MAYFPMYINLEHASCLVVGGGTIAVRKVKVLKDFGAHVTVIAADILPVIEKTEDVVCVQRPLDFSEISQYELVVAATSDKELNHKIAIYCKRIHVPVNVVDQIEDCTFIFPSYVKKGEVVAAFSSSGLSPVVTQYLKKKNEQILTDLVGKTADYLGAIRNEVKRTYHTEKERKAVYEEILRRSLEQGEIQTEERMKDDGSNKKITKQ